MKLTKDDLLTMKDGLQSLGAPSMKGSRLYEIWKDFPLQQILDNQVFRKEINTLISPYELPELIEKAEICKVGQCDGVLKWSTRFRESQEKLKLYEILGSSPEEIDKQLNVNITLKEDKQALTNQSLEYCDDVHNLKQKLEHSAGKLKKIKEFYDKGEETFHINEIKAILKEGK